MEPFDGGASGQQPIRRSMGGNWMMVESWNYVNSDLDV